MNRNIPILSWPSTCNRLNHHHNSKCHRTIIAKESLEQFGKIVIREKFWFPKINFEANFFVIATPIIILGRGKPQIWGIAICRKIETLQIDLRIGLIASRSMSSTSSASTSSTSSTSSASSTFKCLPKPRNRRFDRFELVGAGGGGKIRGWGTVAWSAVRSSNPNFKVATGSNSCKLRQTKEH